MCIILKLKFRSTHRTTLFAFFFVWRLGDFLYVRCLGNNKLKLWNMVSIAFFLRLLLCCFLSYFFVCLFLGHIWHDGYCVFIFMCEWVSVWVCMFLMCVNLSFLLLNSLSLFIYFFNYYFILLCNTIYRLNTFKVVHNKFFKFLTFYFFFFFVNLNFENRVRERTHS